MSADSTPPPNPGKAKRREVRRLVDYSVMGLVFPLATVLGYFAGTWIGGWLGNEELGGWIGGLLGIAAGFYNLIEMSQKLSREDSGSGGASDGGG